MILKNGYYYDTLIKDFQKIRKESIINILANTKKEEKNMNILAHKFF